MCHHKFIRTILLFISIVSLEVLASQKDLDEEYEKLYKVFNSRNYSLIKATFDRLHWSGISDPKLYDIIEDEFKNTFDQALKTPDRTSLEQASWYGKWLGRSGNDKYRTTLENAYHKTNHEKLERHLKTALRDLDLYSEFNPIISKDAAKAPDGKLTEWRIKNMLNSNNPYLIRHAAKRIHNRYYIDEELTDLAAKILESVYLEKHRGVALDAYRWLSKALMSTGKQKYVELLQNVSKNAKGRLKSQAKKDLKILKNKV